MSNIKAGRASCKADTVTRSDPHRHEEGQDIIEYALILPFLLLLTFGIFEGGLLFFHYNTVANAAREGARAGIIPGASEDRHS